MQQVTHPDIKLFHKKRNDKVHSRRAGGDSVIQNENPENAHKRSWKTSGVPNLQKNKKYTKLKGKYGGKTFREQQCLQHRA